jgi:HEAT repeat protein
VTHGPVARAAELAGLGHQGPLAAEAAELAGHAVRDDGDPRVRAAALGALVRAGHSEDALRAWHASVADTAAGVRRRAAELAPALATNPAIAPELTSLLEDRDVTVVEAAAWALGELGQSALDAGAVPSLARVVNDHRDALAREAAVAALGALGDPAGLPAVLAACSDRVGVRRRAVLALAPFSGPDVDAALVHALDDKDWQVRQAAEDLTT